MFSFTGTPPENPAAISVLKSLYKFSYSCTISAETSRNLPKASLSCKILQNFSISVRKRKTRQLVANTARNKPKSSIKNQSQMKTTNHCPHRKNRPSGVTKNTKYCGNRCKVCIAGEREKKGKEYRSKLLVHPASIKWLTEATWDFAHQMLWGCHPFSRAQIRFSKLLISRYYEAITPEKFSATAYKHFAAYCERILLAKDYFSRFLHRHIPHPWDWLDPGDPQGFEGTQRWYWENHAGHNHFQRCESCGK